MTITRMLFGIQGRIRRSQYWACTVGAWVVLLVATLLFGSAVDETTDDFSPMEAVATISWLIFLVAYFWSTICVQAKRCHDRDKTGWFQLISFIPFIGGLWLFIELGFLDGTPGANRFGASPKGIPDVSDAFA